MMLLKTKGFYHCKLSTTKQMELSTNLIEEFGYFLQLDDINCSQEDK
ncbi:MULTISPECIES: hypothetical protein [Metabacillus]|nr:MULTISPECIES: hypothetical protein [Metabacillus]MCM3444004.1 hypothetical protein [Metabacillus halosaccharovorans]